jgi:hypothetical protein
MQKNLSELFGKDMYADSALANTMRSLKNEYREKVTALDDTIDSMYQDSSREDREDARESYRSSLDEAFCIKSAATLMADHNITELVDDMKEDAPRAFPIAANKPPEM